MGRGCLWEVAAALPLGPSLWLGGGDGGGGGGAHALYISTSLVDPTWL